jgi:hypothetical protein
MAAPKPPNSFNEYESDPEEYNNSNVHDSDPRRLGLHNAHVALRKTTAANFPRVLDPRLRVSAAPFVPKGRLPAAPGNLGAANARSPRAANVKRVSRSRSRVRSPGRPKSPGRRNRTPSRSVSRNAPVKRNARMSQHSRSPGARRSGHTTIKKVGNTKNKSKRNTK